MKINYRNRIKKALALLKQSPEPQALVVSSNPAAVRSRDTHFPYRQNSDLYYFTGATAEDLTLVLRPGSSPSAVFISPPVDPVKRVWEGAQPDVKKLARELHIELVLTKEPHAALLGYVRGIQALYTQSVPGTASFRLREDLVRRPADTLRNLPITHHEVETLTARLRSYKEPSEIARIKEAAILTGEALATVAALIKPGMTEREIAAFIDYFYRTNGAEPAFGTIVGAGKSAATLHYRALAGKLRSGDMLLIDTGAELDMYAADITRTFPIGDQPEKPLQVVHESVLTAQRAAIKKVRHGVLIKEVYDAAARELTYGLKEVGVLHGTLSKLLTGRAYKPFFPHGIGHSLGIDVHDVGFLRNNQLARLEKGMVFTIEPGLYFPKRIGRVPACGVRIEDDVLVTASGCQVLSDGIVGHSLTELSELAAHTHHEGCSHEHQT